VPEAADTYGERWADSYDDEHRFMAPSDAQLDLLASLAGDGRALELGIGTGRVALPLVARGVRVDGLDASTSMVAKLRAKPGGDAIPVTIGDMASFDVEGPFRLVYVVFNTIFGLLTQADQVACFRRVAGVLEPGGAFVVECFVPDMTRFVDGQSTRTVFVSDDLVRLDASRHDSVSQRITSSIMSISTGDTKVMPVSIRYAWPSELDLMAELAGLALDARHGGWDGAPFTAASRTHVSVYRRA
jgi:SAM-dependent methyltransferase